MGGYRRPGCEKRARVEPGSWAKFLPGTPLAGGENHIRRKHRNRKFIEKRIGFSWGTELFRCPYADTFPPTPLFLKNFLIPAEGTNDGPPNLLCMPQLSQTRCRTFLVILGRMAVYSFRKH
jgi:hypothetical protein